MSKYRLVTGLVVLIIFASVSFSIALTLSDESKSNRVSSPSPTAPTKILKVVGIVAKITNDTLYLENKKKYDLRNVKVTYNKGKRFSENKKTAEMFFVNGVLKEVVIN
jgi:hypothetical protein